LAGARGWRGRSRVRVGEAIYASGVVFALLIARRASAGPPVGCEPAERFRLANGVEVALEVDHTLPAVAVLSSVHVGQRNDPPGHEDLAHYVEHLTFRSAPPFTPADDLYEYLGAIQMNATTSTDTTDYFAVVPATHRENALWIESRRLAMGLDTVTSATALQERSTMQREYDLRYGVGLGRHPWVGIMKSFFPKGHPYLTALSSEKSISGLTLADARWFFARYYRPERVRVVLVGDFDPARARQLIERSFGTLRARDAKPPPAGSAAPFDASPEAACSWAQRAPKRLHSRVIVRTHDRTERLILAWMHPSTEDAERWVSSLEAFADTVQGAMRQVGIASRVAADVDRLELGVVSLLGVEVTRGRQLTEAESLLRKLLAENLQRANQSDAVAFRQAAQTTDLLRPKTLLSRAQKLAIRACQPAQCAPAASTANPADLSHFPIERALIIEERYARFGDLEGDLDVLQ
jgi:zinc protease